MYKAGEVILSELDAAAQELRLHGPSLGLNNIVLLRDRIWRAANRYFPVRLFRYRPPHLCELEALRHGTVYLSRIRDFDDGHDTFPLLDDERISSIIDMQCTKDNFKAMVGQVDQSSELSNQDNGETARRVAAVVDDDASFDAFLDSFKNVVLQTIHSRSEQWRKDMRCACFTEIEGSNYMWEYYAAREKGFCAEYSVDNEALRCVCDGWKTCDASLLTSLLPVRYDGRAVVDQLSYILAGYHDGLPFPSGEEHLLKLLITSHKEKEFQQEHEWRLVAESCGRVRATCYVYLKPVRITAGKRCDAHFREELKRTCDYIGVEMA